MEFRDLGAQYRRLKPEIDEAISGVLDSTQFISGAAVKRLEEKMAGYVGVKHCITCANGTDALEIALKTMGVGIGDAVFVPDFTFLSTAEAVTTVGAVPIFVDVYYDTFNISVESLEDTINKVLNEQKLIPKVVIPVNLFGLPADYVQLKIIAKKYNMVILEDAAQSFGGRIGNKMACSFGDISTTSFFPAKPLGCYGDGGAIFTDNDEWADYMRSICVHGKGKSKYENIRSGRNSRLDTLQAAILEVKFKSFVDFELDAINKAANLYNEKMGKSYDLPIVPQGYYSSFAQYSIKVSDEYQREILIRTLAEKKIPTAIHYPIPLHRQGAYIDMMFKDIDFPISERLVRTVLCLPISPDISEEDITFITDTINQIDF